MSVVKIWADLNSTVPFTPIKASEPKHILRVTLFFCRKTYSTVSSLIPASSICTCSLLTPHSKATSLIFTRASFASNSDYCIVGTFSAFSTSLSDDFGPGQYT